MPGYSRVVTSAMVTAIFDPKPSWGGLPPDRPGTSLADSSLSLPPQSLPSEPVGTQCPAHLSRALSVHRLLGSKRVWTARHLQVRPGQDRRHEHQGVQRPLGRGRLGAAGQVTLRGTLGICWSPSAGALRAASQSHRTLLQIPRARGS